MKYAKGRQACFNGVNKTWRTKLKLGITIAAFISLTTIGVVHQYQIQNQYLNKNAIERTMFEKSKMLFGNTPYWIRGLGGLLDRFHHCWHFQYDSDILPQCSFSHAGWIVKNNMKDKYKVEFERVSDELHQFLENKKLLANPSDDIFIEVIPHSSSNQITWKVIENVKRNNNLVAKIVINVPDELYLALLNFSNNNLIDSIFGKTLTLGNNSIDNGVFTVRQFEYPNNDLPTWGYDATYFCESGQCFRPDNNTIYDRLEIKYFGSSILTSPSIYYILNRPTNKAGSQDISRETKEQSSLNIIKTLHKNMQYSLHEKPHRSYNYWLPLKEKDIPIVFQQLIDINNTYNDIVPNSFKHIKEDELAKHNLVQEPNTLFFHGATPLPDEHLEATLFDYYFTLRATEKFGHLWIDIKPISSKSSQEPANASGIWTKIIDLE